MKQVKNILLIYISLVLVIILFKFVLWVKIDYPIGRLSIVYLLSLIAVLKFRNRITFVLLWLLAILPFAWRILEYNISGSTSFEYTYVFYQYLYDDYSKTAQFFIHFPYYFSILLCLTTLPKTVRLLYGMTKMDT